MVTFNGAKRVALAQIELFKSGGRAWSKMSRANIYRHLIESIETVDQQFGHRMVMNTGEWHFPLISMYLFLIRIYTTPSWCLLAMSHSAIVNCFPFGWPKAAQPHFRLAAFKSSNFIRPLVTLQTIVWKGSVIFCPICIETKQKQRLETQWNLH